jgi:hypothetical protein
MGELKITPADWPRYGGAFSFRAPPSREALGLLPFLEFY